MKADIECHGCCVRKAEGLLEQYQVPDEKKAQVMEAVEKTVREAKAEESAPEMMAKVMRILEAGVGITDAYDIPKKRYNELLLSKEDGICQEIRQEKDPFFSALQYAITGNYIDFGAMSDVNEQIATALPLMPGRLPCLERNWLARRNWCILQTMRGRSCWIKSLSA